MPKLKPAGNQRAGWRADNLGGRQLPSAAKTRGLVLHNPWLMRLNHVS
jgi:hypothetical protein